MRFMTMLAIALLVGFFMGMMVWVIWSIVERVLARKTVTEPASGENGGAEGKGTTEKGKTDAKAGAK